METLIQKRSETIGRNTYNRVGVAAILVILVVSVLLYGCNSSSGNTAPPQNVQSLPVILITRLPATIFQEFSASLEGKKNIEVRPQVDGYLEKIYVDEGAYVKKGQLLFQINDREYREQVNNARASLSAAKANLSNAQINVSKLTPLVQNNVVSDVQLKSAQAAYDAAEANVSQSQAMLRNAEINLGYTVIRANVDGYIGRIPMKVGSLVGPSKEEALTVLSEIKDIYAYFSLSEQEFLKFKNQFPGNSVEEKIKQMPPVELVLADNSIYPQKGKVETVSGQFSSSTGAISFRAIFKNTEGLLRSGNTGRIRIPQSITGALIVPQEATFEIQDKVFVFAVDDSNKVISKPISIAGKNPSYYFVESGIQAGEKIVFSGIGNLRDGMVISPQPISVDSLLKVKPL